jgi:DNA-binding response OmpR family regulator
MTKSRAGRRVLVVEDEFMVAMGLEMVLSDAGYTVIGPIGRFDQALEAATVHEVDFALLDVNVRGVEVFPIADILAKRGIPFAFLTGYDKETIPLGPVKANVLSKPFKATELLAAVDAMIG